MASTRKSEPAAARPRQTGSRSRRSWRRLLSLRVAAAIAATLLVAAGGIFLHLYVTITGRFDGRLWLIPSRVWSDTLVLARGASLSADEFEARLLRSGYAKAETAPARPGGFSRHGATLDVWLREFASPTVRVDKARVEVRFSGDRVAALRAHGGKSAERAVLEPELLATLYGPRQEERRPVRLDDVPETVRQAVLAAEDSNFFAHDGLDLRGIVRAAWVNVREGGIVQGGSTITQQTVKNLFLGQERTWWRKGREAAMALILDARYPKHRILEVYLNEVYLGQRGPVAICGVEAASRHYFGVGVAELSLGEAALLAGMIRNPGGYNPFVEPAAALERRGRILDAMRRLGSIDQEAADAAAADPLRLASRDRGFAGAAYAVDFVQTQLAELYPRSELNTEGLHIYTSIDTRLQGVAEGALERGLARLERDVPTVKRQLEERELQGAIVVTRPESGAILAMVGGRDYRKTQFNRAAQARRQPGSCFKPLVYVAGFEEAAAGGTNGLTAATLLDDSPIEMISGGKEWKPANYDREYRGIVTARRALEESLNIPTVRAAQVVGLERIVEVAKACGIHSPMRPLPSLALGTAEVTPLELTTVYGTFAEKGVRTEPWIIRGVTDAEGRRLEGRGLVRETALSPAAAFLITDLLFGVFERGTARSARVHGYHGGAAGKTGTTDDTRDAWFVGFDDELLTMVWVGYDDNSRTGLTGASGALPIWVDVMRHSPAADVPLTLEVPSGVVAADIDLETGELAVARCRAVFREHFIRGTEPQRHCSLHEGRLRRWFDRFRRDPGAEPVSARP